MAQQAAANQAAANAGPVAMPLREQATSAPEEFAGILRTGNEADIAGTSLYPSARRRGAAARALGY
jgi:hypothetical protein